MYRPLKSRRKKPRSKINWNLFALGKGPTRKQISDREDRVHAAARLEARARAFVRDKSQCRNCHRFLFLHTDNPFALAHAHEIILRSAGGPDTDTRNVVTLCAECHLHALHKQGHWRTWLAIIVWNPSADEGGANSRLTFVPWAERERYAWQERLAALAVLLRQKITGTDGS